MKRDTCTPAPGTGGFTSGSRFRLERTIERMENQFPFPKAGFGVHCL